MTEDFTVPADMTDEQAKVEIEKMQIEIRANLAQIKRDREEGALISARTEAVMSEVRVMRDRLMASL